MSCVLRVAAPGIAEAVGRVSLKPYRIDGDTALFDVSKGGFRRLDTQIEDAITFLGREKESLEFLMGLPSCSACLDFGIENLDKPAQFRRFPPELLCLAGKAGIGLELSIYIISEESGAEA